MYTVYNINKYTNRSNNFLKKENYSNKSNE